MRVFLIALLVGGCAPVRFVDRPPVWNAHDDKPILQPRENPLAIDWAGMRDAIFMPLDRVLKLDYGRESLNVNSLDEVPESSWFHDVRRHAPDDETRPAPIGSREMELGASVPDDVPVPPLTVVSAKQIGATAGFVAKDARGVRYLIKLDPPGRQRFATSVEVVVSRLAWAAGWRVPSEVMVHIPASDILVADNASSKDANGVKLPFTHKELARLLFGRSDASGELWLLASRWLPGVSIGPFQYFGRRRDDFNDHYPHENRREVRGFGVFSAWVNNIDTLENNTLDMYEGPPGRGHVVHYQQDVGGAFGVWAFSTMRPWMGHETYFDFPHIMASLLTFGALHTYWEDESFVKDYERRASRNVELGAFDAHHFDPRRWNATLPNAAFSRQTGRDRYWAAKRIALIDARELRAAIAAGHYPPEVAEQLFQILAKRRELLLRAFLGDMAALDYFRFERNNLCFDDIWLRAGLGGAPQYAARDGRRELTVRAADDGTACIDLGKKDGYRILDLRLTDKERGRGKPVRVHVKAGRILGIER